LIGPFERDARLCQQRAAADRSFTTLWSAGVLCCLGILGFCFLFLVFHFNILNYALNMCPDVDNVTLPRYWDRRVRRKPSNSGPRWDAVCPKNTLAYDIANDTQLTEWQQEFSRYSADKGYEIRQYLHWSTSQDALRKHREAFVNAAADSMKNATARAAAAEEAAAETHQFAAAIVAELKNEAVGIREAATLRCAVAAAGKAIATKQAAEQKASAQAANKTVVELATELEKLSKISLEGGFVGWWFLAARLARDLLARLTRDFVDLVQKCGSFWTSGHEFETGWDDMFTKWLGVMPGWARFASKHGITYLIVSWLLNQAKQNISWILRQAKTFGVPNVLAKLVLVVLTKVSELYFFVLVKGICVVACVGYCTSWDWLFSYLMDLHTEYWALLASFVLTSLIGWIADDKTWHTHSEFRAILGKQVLFFMFVGQVLFGISCVATLLLYSYSEPPTLINTISTELWACYENQTSAPSCGNAARTSTMSVRSVSWPHFGEGTWISHGLESIPEIRKYLSPKAEAGDGGNISGVMQFLITIGVIFRGLISFVMTNAKAVINSITNRFENWVQKVASDGVLNVFLGWCGFDSAHDARTSSKFDDTITVQLNIWDTTTTPKAGKDGVLKFYTLATIPVSALILGQADGEALKAGLKEAALRTVDRHAFVFLSEKNEIRTRLMTLLQVFP
jgi:hypothetical protein